MRYDFPELFLPVPCSYSHIYPLSCRPPRLHRLSSLPSGWCKSELHTAAGTRARARAPGRTASSFSTRRCCRPSSTPLLFTPTLPPPPPPPPPPPTRQQTTKLLQEPRGTLIEKCPRRNTENPRRGEWPRGGGNNNGRWVASPQSAAFHMGD